MGKATLESKWATQRMRTVWKINDNLRDAGLVIPDDVLWAENILFGPYGNWNLLDIYYPKSALVKSRADSAFPVIGKDGRRVSVEASGKLPVIFDIHGGGWQYGDKELYRHYNIALAQKGFAVIGFNYRIAPEDYFPAAFTDVNRAMNWVAKNADKYGLDTEKVFILGDSAGGQMASWYCTLLTNAPFRKVYEELFPLEGKGETAAFTWEEYIRRDLGDAFDPASWKDMPMENMEPDATYRFEVPFDKVHVRACALNCGCYDMVTSLNNATALGAFEQFLGELYESRKEEVKKLVDAWNYMDAAFPPAFVMSAANDFLREEAAPMGEHLKSIGVENEVHIYGEPEQKYMGHVFHINQKLTESAQCNEDECSFFKKHM